MYFPPSVLARRKLINQELQKSEVTVAPFITPTGDGLGINHWLILSDLPQGFVHIHQHKIVKTETLLTG